MTRQCSEDQYLICIVWLRYWQRVVCSSISPWSSLLGHDPISNIHSLSAPVSNAGQVTLTIVSPSIVVITIGSGGILRCIHTLLHSLTPVSTTCAELSWAGAPVSTLSVECWMGNCELCDSVSRPLVLVCDTDNMWQWWWDSTWPGSHLNIRRGNHLTRILTVVSQILSQTLAVSHPTLILVHHHHHHYHHYQVQSKLVLVDQVRMSFAIWFKIMKSEKWD